MSLFQFSAYVQGWNKAQGGDKQEAPTEDEFEAMLVESAERDARQAR